MPSIVMFCEQRWADIGQRPAKFVAHLANSDDLVYVEPPIVADVPEPCLEAVQVEDSVTVVVPRLPAHSTVGAQSDRTVSARLIGNYLAESGIGDYVAWLFSASSVDLLDWLSPLATIYDCSGETSPGRTPSACREREALLMRKSDLVITPGPGLFASMRAQHGRVVCIPSGVDATEFSPISAARLPGHVAYAAGLHEGIGYPRLGFYGDIDDRLDYELIAALADANSSWQIVLAGDVSDAAACRLPRRSNIHYLPQPPRQYLPHVIAQWSVCLLPYVVNTSTSHLNPSQALEYMSYGRPVVSTPLPDSCELYDGAMRIAADPTSFIQACKACAVAYPGDKQSRERAALEVVQRSSWEIATRKVSDAVAELIQPRLAAERLRTKGMLPADDSVEMESR